MKVFAGVVILFDQNRHRCAEGLWEVLVERLLLGSPVLSLEHIFNSVKESTQVRLHFSAPLLNLGIVLSTVNSIKYLLLSLWIATWLCSGDCFSATCRLWTFCRCLPVFSHLVEKWMLIDQCHHVCLVTSRVWVSFFDVLQDAAHSICLNLSRPMGYSCNYSVLPHGSGLA
jgi:hypothetical protein